MPRGRPKLYTNEELKAKRAEYMRTKEWYCNFCKQHYSLGNKTCHLQTRKHTLNYIMTLNKDYLVG